MGIKGVSLTQHPNPVRLQCKKACNRGAEPFRLWLVRLVCSKCRGFSHCWFLTYYIVFSVLFDPLTKKARVLLKDGTPSWPRILLTTTPALYFQTKKINLLTW